MIARLRSVPAPLSALMTVSALLAVIWACVTPAFQAPDEQAHFAYVETLANRFVLPGDRSRFIFSKQVQEGMAWTNSNQAAGQPAIKLEWSPEAERRWLVQDAAASRSDGGGPTPASTYPPVAYAWQTLGYLAGSSATLWDELLGARLMSALWLPVTVLMTWLLAGELFGRQRLLQTIAASVPALLPMVAFVSASVSPDGMLYAVWTAALWLGVRCVRRGVPVPDGAAFFAVVGLACTVKATSFALLPAAAFVALVGIAARRPWRIPRVAALGAAIAIPLALTLGAWILLAATLDRPAAAQVSQQAATAGAPGGTNWRELISYVWQYYLPRIPGQVDYPVPAAGGGYPTLHIWITQIWAAFGWLEVKFVPWVYRVLAVITAVVGLGAVAALWRARRAIEWRVAGVLVLAGAALLAGLHWTDYHQIEAGSTFIQGRYLFPLVGLMGAGLAAAVSVVPIQWRATLAGGTVSALLVFHLLCLGLVLERFYA